MKIIVITGRLHIQDDVKRALEEDGPDGIVVVQALSLEKAQWHAHPDRCDFGVCVIDTATPYLTGGLYRPSVDTSYVTTAMMRRAGVPIVAISDQYKHVVRARQRGDMICALGDGARTIARTALRQLGV